MKLTMLGTGNALVTECYNTCFIIDDNNKYFMVDGGGGNTILSQINKAGYNWQDIREIFVTHKHIDHILGIIWMVRMICQNMNKGKYDGEANIYAHDEVIEIIRDMALKLLPEKITKMLDTRLHLVEVHNGETKIINEREVTFFDIESTKAKQYGFTMKISDDEKLTCCGEEPFADCERKYAENSKWLLHEAFCLYSEAHIFDPYEKHHSTVKEACELAEALHAQNLILYHTEDKNIKNRKTLYLEEGKKYYTGNLYVPDDLEAIEL